MSALNSSARLSDVCRFQNGGTPSKGIERYFTGDIPWITGADLVGPIALQARSFITEEAIASSATNQVPAGTVLLVTRTSVGKVAIAGMSLCFSQDITALTPDAKKLSAEYLVHFLRTKQEHFTKHARGATIQGITREVVADLEIPLPLLEEQRRIAAILDQAETLRTQRRQALAHLDTLTQSLFLDMFGEQSNFPLVPLDQVCELITDGTHYTPTYADEGVIFLSAKNVTSGRIDWERIKHIPESLHQELHKRVAPKLGDVLMAKNGTTGVAAIVDRDCTFDIYVSLALLRPSSKIGSLFLHAALNSPLSKKQFNAALKGIGVPNLHLKDIRGTNIPVPPLALQQTFATRIQAIEALKTTHRSALAQLDALFASLQQRAFAGEL